MALQNPKKPKHKFLEGCDTHSGLKMYVAISGSKLNLSLNNLYFLKVLFNPNGVSLLDRKPVTAGFISGILDLSVIY